MREHLAHRLTQLAMSPLNAVISVRDHNVVNLPRRKRLAIVAAGSSRHRSPDYLRMLDDSDCEVWGLNAVPVLDAKTRLRCDRWFDIHQRCSQSEDDLEFIRKCPVPIYVPEDLLNEAEHTVSYPLERIERWLGRRGFFSCTFGYQLALAMFEGYKEIRLFGVDLFYGDARERTVEASCVNWWMGYAEAKGVNVVVPSGSLLGQHPHYYGLEYQAEKSAVEQYVRNVKMGDLSREYARLEEESFKSGKQKDETQVELGGIGG